MRNLLLIAALALGFIANAQIETKSTKIPKANHVSIEPERGVIKDSLKQLWLYDDDELIQVVGHKIYHKKFKRYAKVLEVKDGRYVGMDLVIEWEKKEDPNKKKKKKSNVRIQTISSTYLTDFVLVPNYEKLQSMVGDQVFVVNKDNFSSKPVVDLNTGNVIPDSQLRGYWTIVDFSLVKERFHSPTLTLQNEAGQRIFFQADFNRASKVKGFSVLSQDFIDDMEATLTQKEFDAVFARKIFVGMSLKALLLSWGEPEDINRSSYGDAQYVYGYQYVYVNRDGFITAWQS